MNEQSRFSQIDEKVSGWLIGAFRICLGVLWLANLEWKRPPDFGFNQKNGLYKYVDSAVRLPVNDQFAWFIKNVVMKNYTFFGWVTLLMEALLAALLISGLFTRFAALLGAGLSVNIMLSVLYYDKAYEWPWSYYLMIAGHLALFATAAGRYIGIDGARFEGGAALDRARIALGSVAMTVGLIGWIVVRSSSFTADPGVMIGFNRWELKVLWFNQLSAILTLVLGAILLASGISRRRGLAIIPAVVFGLMCLQVLVQWRVTPDGVKSGFLGGTGATFGFWLMLCLGAVGTLAPAIGRRR